MTITERADKIYCDFNTDLVLDSASDYQRLGYIRGAGEQQKIDRDLFIELIYNLMETGDIQVRNIDKVIESINGKTDNI